MPLISNRPIFGQSYVVLTKMYQVTHDKKYLYAGSFTEVPEAEQLQKFDKCGKGTKKRCFHCLESVRGPWFSQKKLKVPRIMTQCQECGAPSCMTKHLISLCTTCYVPPGKEKGDVCGDSSEEVHNVTTSDSVNDGDQVERNERSEEGQVDSDLEQSDDEMHLECKQDNIKEGEDKEKCYQTILEYK